MFPSCLSAVWKMKSFRKLCLVLLLLNESCTSHALAGQFRLSNSPYLILWLIDPVFGQSITYEATLLNLRSEKQNMACHTQRRPQQLGQRERLLPLYIWFLEREGFRWALNERLMQAVCSWNSSFRHPAFVLCEKRRAILKGQSSQYLSRNIAVVLQSQILKLLLKLDDLHQRWMTFPSVLVGYDWDVESIIDMYQCEIKHNLMRRFPWVVEKDSE